jgi:hypothetical protein
MIHKIQITKLQSTNKYQMQMTETPNVWNLELEVYLLFGVWDLIFLIVRESIH